MILRKSFLKSVLKTKNIRKVDKQPTEQKELKQWCDLKTKEIEFLDKTEGSQKLILKKEAEMRKDKGFFFQKKVEPGSFSLLPALSTLLFAKAKERCKTQKTKIKVYSDKKRERKE